ncbi:MAG: response regulator [Lacunisphaera sp.]
MKTPDPDVIIPSILLVDDESQIHSALKLRLGDSYRMVSASTPQEALSLIAGEPFDLCIADVQMPGMNGLTFIETAKKVDPALGYVIFSGFDSDENLRKAIPLHVFDFVTKPLPDRHRFERQIPGWIERTRKKRLELAQTRNTEAIVRDLEVARIEREVESTASESAREALFQTAGRLTTAQALLLNACHVLEPVIKNDPRLTQAVRSLREARDQVEVASGITDEYFGSAYANRDSSPALIDLCTRHAIAIGSRLAGAEARQQAIDHRILGQEITAAGLTGIEFLILLVPAIVQTLKLAAPGSTSRIQCDLVTRLDEAYRGTRANDFLWINRRNALLSNPGVKISVVANTAAPPEADVAAWLREKPTKLLSIPSHGLITGIQTSKGLAGVAIHPEATRFEIVLVLPI